ncbi:MAG: hypothetical protein ACKOA8_15980, partial [Deltaproteobacteria bacterium]
PAQVEGSKPINPDQNIALGILSLFKMEYTNKVLKPSTRAQNSRYLVIELPKNSMSPAENKSPTIG